MKFNSLYIAKNVAWVLFNFITLLAIRFVYILLKQYMVWYSFFHEGQSMIEPQIAFYGTLGVLIILQIISNIYFMLWANK